MNILKALLDLIPKQARFYGRIISINGDRINIEPINGGLLSVYNIVYAQSFASGQYVWMTQDDNGEWTLDPAPTFLSTGTVEV